MSFSQFKLRPSVLKGLEALGFTQPTPVQQQAIPVVLEGRDAIVQAKTGSGKTLAFGLPLLTMLEPRGGLPQVVIVLPTRELALQVRDSLHAVAPNGPLRLCAIYGGVGLEPQEKALRQGVDIVIGTPGRLKDLMGRKSLDLSKVHVLVLDEADQMLDMGFRRDIEFLMGRMPAREQTIIFSATMPEPIRAIAHQHLKDPVPVQAQSEEKVPRLIEHQFVRVTQEKRIEALISLIAAESPDRAIIFTQMKHETKRLGLKLEKLAGFQAGFLNGNMSQNARNTMLARFKGGELRYLVATDVAARGLDIEGVSHVFHYAVPTTLETYIHRSGRTGRAGQSGISICLVTPDGEEAFRPIQKRLPMKEREVPPLPFELPDANAPVPGERPDRPTRTPREPSRRPRGERAPRPEAAVQQAPQVWKKFKLNLTTLPESTPNRLHSWLAHRTGIAPAAIRSVTVLPTHAVVEVDASQSDRFVQRLRQSEKGGRR